VETTDEEKRANYNVYKYFRALLFRIDPERAHEIILGLMRFVGGLPLLQNELGRIYCVSDPRLEVRVFGLDFSNPVGLAAGYDKNGIGMQGLSSLGFGHLELGTVTPKPQVGNPRPRIIRLPEDRALINSMGFPNAGAQALLQRLRAGSPEQALIGVNIGKGAETPLENAEADYLYLLRAFYPYADYLAVNISSPNTIGLRRLQARKYLEGLLGCLRAEGDELAQATDRSVPLLVKLSPDLADDELGDAVEVIIKSSFDGVIATNTTIARAGLQSPGQAAVGGLSGVPLRERAIEVVSKIHDWTDGQLPIIGVGGIFGPEDARAMLNAGASLIQLYTGLVYHGPGLVRQILLGLLQEML
jgi:dihydroorotate dehydrogenase